MRTRIIVLMVAWLASIGLTHNASGLKRQEIRPLASQDAWNDYVQYPQRQAPHDQAAVQQHALR